MASLKLNPTQQELMKLVADPQIKHLLVYGGTRGGKSFGIMLAVIRRAMAYPGSRHGVFRSTLNAVNRSLGPVHGTFREAMNALFPGLYDQCSVLKAESMVILPNGSEIIFEGLDETRAEKVLGLQYGTVWINECNHVRDFRIIQKLQSRMTDPATLWLPNKKGILENTGRPINPLMIMDCNPDVETDWDCLAFRDKVHPLTNKPWAKPEQWATLWVPPKDNERNQSENYLEDLAANYEGSPDMEARFLKGVWRTENPDALFRMSMFQRGDIAPQLLSKIVVGVDPAGNDGNKGDKTGITVAGLGPDGKVYVLFSEAASGNPEKWGPRVAELTRAYNADYVVAEKNFGGTMVQHTIQVYDRYLVVKPVNASRGKFLRAQPIAMAYHQGKVVHTQDFKELEAQMCGYNPDTTKKSPDMMDSLVWAIHDLLKLGGTGSSITSRSGGGVWRA